LKLLVKQCFNVWPAGVMVKA